MKKLEYRKDIDGLRGIAVLSVILYHAGIPLFDGGFIGVDIFFVISGYLITSIILIQKENNTFSLINFYERRAKRILPALFVVMTASTLVAWQWMLPNPFQEFARSLIATSWFWANLFFWRGTDYFSLSADEKPLLHTWSLAVEEQFYILFPFVVLLLWRWKRQWLFPLLLVAIGISFGISEWGWRYKPHANFYWMPTRIWEIGLGCLAAFLHGYHRSHIDKFKGAHTWLSVVGASLILSSIFIFDENTPNPSYWVLFPLLGTVLLLLCVKPHSFIYRLFTFKPLTFVGLISYSAYLWHQPIFSFISIRMLNTPPLMVFLLSIPVILGVAWLSWKFVEQPARHSTLLPPKVLLGSCLGVMIAFTAMGWHIHRHKGVVSRLPVTVQYLADPMHLRAPRARECYGVAPENACIYGDDTNVTGALLGDSHALALLAQLDEAFEKAGIGFKSFAQPSCISLVNLQRTLRADHCLEYTQDIFDYLASDAAADLDFLILSSRWTLYLECVGFDNREGGVEKNDNCIDIVDKESDTPRSITDVEEQYSRAIQTLLALNKKIILVYPVPEVGWHVPDYVMQRSLFDNTTDVLSTDYQTFLERNYRSYQALDAVGQHPNIHRVYPENIFCNSFLENRCVAYWKGASFYYDDDHLSLVGSALVVENIVNVIER